MLIKYLIKNKKTVSVIMTFFLVAGLGLTLPLTAKAVTSFGLFTAYGGKIIAYETIYGTDWIFYTHYDATAGGSITKSLGVLNMNVALTNGPCTVVGSSILGYGIGMGASTASFGIALVLYCSATQVKN